MSDDVSADLHDEIRSVLADVLDKGPAEIAASWAACAEAGLLGLAAPAEHGGEGLGLAEVAVLVREVAARALDLPVRETLVCGLLPLSLAGHAGAAGDLRPADRRRRPARRPGARTRSAWRCPPSRRRGSRTSASPVASSRSRCTTTSPTAPPCSSSRSRDRTGAQVALVDPASEGVTRTDTPSSSGRTEATYDFDGAPVLGVLGDDAAGILRRHAVAGLLLQGEGLLAGARDLTAGYVKEREQFGRRLAEFQGVAIQIADVYVTSRMVALATEEATRRVAAGEPADDDLAIATFWFCDRAPAALQTCHHLHGGMGVDETYPLHRYFARAKDVARLLGGADAALAAAPAGDEAPDESTELTAEQRAFRDEVRSYFAGLVSPEDRAQMMSDRHGEAYHRTIRQMGTDGWMGVAWPVEYGGKGLGGIEEQIFANEAARADVHLPSVTLQTVGPTLQAFGTEKQKDLFLKRILEGDVHFAIGYSEPDAGTDLASLRTTARREGDEYVVNGQKMWTTGGHVADYVWLAVRTDPDAPKHKGISVLIVDTKDPGYSWTPIVTSDSSHHTNATYYNDVRVPADMLVGEENQGWRLITTQLNHERVMLGPAGRLEGLRDLVVEWARDRKDASGTPLLSVPAVRDTLARTTAAFRVNELLNWQVAGAGAIRVAGRSPTPRPRRSSPPTRCSRWGWRSSASSRRTATRRTPRPRRWCATSTRPPSATSCSPSAVASTRCSAS